MYAYRMNSVYDPVYAAGISSWDSRASYHYYMASLYNQYRVIKSWITVKIVNLATYNQLNYTGAPGGPAVQDRFSSAMAVSLLLDDNGNTGVASDYWWVNLKTNPSAKVMLVHPTADQAKYVYTLKSGWSIPKNQWADDNTWASVSANPDTSMGNSRGLAVLLFQRASLTAQSTVENGFPPFSVQTRIVYKVQYRFPKDVGYPLGQSQTHAPPMSAFVGEDKVVEKLIGDDGAVIEGVTEEQLDNELNKEE